MAFTTLPDVYKAALLRSLATATTPVATTPGNDPATLAVDAMSASSPTFPVTGVTPPGATSVPGVGSSNPRGLPTYLPTGSMPPGGLPTTGVYAPFGITADAPPAWLAKNALDAYNRGDTKYRDHLLSDPTIAGDPHLKNFVVQLFQGNADRIAEAQHYATNPSYNGWNNAAGNGIPGDFM